MTRWWPRWKVGKREALGAGFAARYDELEAQLTQLKHKVDANIASLASHAATPPSRGTHPATWPGLCRPLLSRQPRCP